MTLLDTGANTMTGGRLLRAKKYIGDETFSFTYGDGVTDLDVRNVIDHHRATGKVVTVTAVQPPTRYGALEFDDSHVSFQEKPIGEGGWVNGGFFVAEPSILDYIDGDDTVFEQTPLQRLASDQELSAYQHGGFWRGMDTLWDKIYLNELWQNEKAPWKTWATQSA